MASISIKLGLARAIRGSNTRANSIKVSRTTPNYRIKMCPFQHPLASPQLRSQSVVDYPGSHPNPVPGMPIKNPRVRPARGQVITHYEVFQPQVSLWLSLLCTLPAVPTFSGLHRELAKG